MNNNWIESTILFENRRAIKVVNIVGTPARLEMDVNDYLAKGYDIGGPMMPYHDPETPRSLYTQQVILYEQEEDNGGTTTRREN